MFFSCTAGEDIAMIYRTPARPAQFLANIGGAILVGLVFAVVGLNAASGCGEHSGQCIGLKDFVGHEVQLTAR
jgi:hypothetical protein